jgi:2-methylcitrate dehydratase PrpD
MHTEKLLEFLTGTTLEDLPTSVRDGAKLRVLDTLGIALAATSTTHAPQIEAALDALSEDGNATVIGSARRRSLSGAILLNGALAHGIDFDDSHKFVTRAVRSFRSRWHSRSTTARTARSFSGP